MLYGNVNSKYKYTEQYRHKASKHSVKAQSVNSLGFAGHVVSVGRIQVSSLGQKQPGPQC